MNNNNYNPYYYYNYYNSYYYQHPPPPQLPHYNSNTGLNYYYSNQYYYNPYSYPQFNSYTTSDTCTTATNASDTSGYDVSGFDFSTPSTCSSSSTNRNIISSCSNSTCINTDDSLKETFNEATLEGKNVYVSGLCSSFTTDLLLSLFPKNLNILSAKAIIQQISSKRTEEYICKGYGFVLFNSTEDALEGIKILTQKGYKASIAKESISSRLKLLEDKESCNLYLYNLAPDITRIQLHEYVNHQLRLVSHQEIMQDSTQNDQKTTYSGYSLNSNGYVEQLFILDHCAVGTVKYNTCTKSGFIRVDSRETAEILLHALNGININGFQIQVRFADTPAQKKLKRLQKSSTLLSYRSVTFK